MWPVQRLTVSSDLISRQQTTLLATLCNTQNLSSEMTKPQNPNMSLESAEETIYVESQSTKYES